jgi:SAM-dependent methyltransferase
VATADRHRLRATFEGVAELYDRARPRYPAEVFEDFRAVTGLGPGARVVEIGCGTGQATRALAERGFEVVAVELGSRLAALAQDNLAAFDNVEIVNAAFETWQPRQADFDAAASFTAFHWIDPHVRYGRVASLVRRSGALAIFEAPHVLLQDGDPFWAEVQEDYDAVIPHPDNRPPPPPDEVGDLAAEIDGSGYFHTVAVRRRLWQVTYTADEYVALLGTFSPNLALDPETRRRLFDRIRRRIESRPEGTVTKTRLATLNVARRLDR